MPAELHELPKRDRWEPVPEVVEHCYQLLQKAKAGQLRAIAYALVEVHEGEEDGVANAGLLASPRTRFALSHALRILEQRWTEACNEARGEG